MMYDRMKSFLLKMLNVVVSLLIFAVAGIYAAIAGILTTVVVNDFRLDAYIGFETGIAIVLLLIMLGYIPLYGVIRSARD
tara:strand:+ start:281 stop:520 length:240 start_codon:yes stop_codon:yes gene_type:complete